MLQLESKSQVQYTYYSTYNPKIVFPKRMQVVQLNYLEVTYSTVSRGIVENIPLSGARAEVNESTYTSSIGTGN